MVVLTTQDLDEISRKVKQKIKRENNLKEYPIPEFGYFTKGECEIVKDIMDGASYMDFRVAYSNYAGNCTLIIKTDYDAPEEEIKRFFISCLIGEFCRISRYWKQA